MKKKYQQQAFPNAVSTAPYASKHEGMTLLDYFAAKAASAICQDIETFRVNDFGLDAKRIAESSYDIAAAMIEERKKYINE